MSDYIYPTQQGATFSPNRKYRYTLWRRRGPIPEIFDLGMAAFIGLNPSTAEEEINDPTVTRCINYAERWNCSGMIMLNLFAWRDTDPRGMKSVDEPIGALNDDAILSVCREAGRVVCCWGNHGRYKSRAFHVLRRLVAEDIPLWHLGRTKSGEPRHPLYLRADLEPERWEVDRADLVARMLSGKF